MTVKEEDDNGFRPDRVGNSPSCDNREFDKNLDRKEICDCDAIDTCPDSIYNLERINKNVIQQSELNKPLNEGVIPAHDDEVRTEISPSPQNSDGTTRVFFARDAVDIFGEDPRLIIKVKNSFPEKNSEKRSQSRKCITDDFDSSACVRRVARTVTSRAFSSNVRILGFLLGTYALLTTISSAYLFTEWFQIPRLNKIQASLNAEVSNLTEVLNSLEKEAQSLKDQNIRLNSEIDSLIEHNFEYENLGTQLSVNITRKEDLNLKLQGLNHDYKALNSNLNLTNTNKKNLNEDLTNEVERIVQMNDDLETSIDLLVNETNLLEESIRSLDVEISNMTGVLENLDRQIDLLEENSINLTKNVNELETLVDSHRNQTDFLAFNIQELSEIVLFLNTTYQNRARVFDSLSYFIEQVTNSWRESALNNIESTMKNARSLWLWELTSRYASEPWLENKTRPIGAEAYNDIIQWAYPMYWKELCIDLKDMEKFILNEVTPDNLFVDGGVFIYYTLQQAVYQYGFLAVDFYFARNRDQVPFSEFDWEFANYKCENIQLERRFCIYGNCSFNDEV